MAHRHSLECARVQLAWHTRVPVSRTKSYIVLIWSWQWHVWMGHISIGVFRDKLSCSFKNHLLPVLSHAPSAMEEQFIAVGGVATWKKTNHSTCPHHRGRLRSPLVSHPNGVAAKEPWGVQGWLALDGRAANRRTHPCVRFFVCQSATVRVFIGKFPKVI